MQLKKELCQFTRLVLHNTQNTWCIFVVWFGFTGMEHLNFNGFVETSFSRCVCLVFDYCQFDCSLHINRLILSQMKLIITVNLLSDEILNFLPSLKALHGFKCFSLFLLHYDFSLLDIEVFCLGIWVLNRRRWLCQ